MAPLKQVNKKATLTTLDRGLKPRSQHVLMKKDVLPKRKADESPLKRITVKRSALGDASNTISLQNEKSDLKEKAIKKQVISTKVTRTCSSSIITRKPLNSTNTSKPPLYPTARGQLKEIQKPQTRQCKATVKEVKSTNTTTIVKTTATISELPKPIKTQAKIIKKGVEISVSKVTKESQKYDTEKGDSSLYVSALEELNLDDGVKDKSGRTSLKKKQRNPPLGVEDFDKENVNDPYCVAIYAMDIFDYLKSREKDFKISDYMHRQLDLNVSMRTLVVNWMIEVQENFELNHETLYLGVKLVDIYLSKVKVNKNKLQLLGCSSLLLAAKYDERYPPTTDDMVYVCDGLYKPEDLLKMEIELLKAVDFQLGIPLSYRFLRRYARCNKFDMSTLSLARYILETSLLDYSTIRYSDSKLAAASLHLALHMEGKKEWTSTLEYYSGYKAQEFKSIMLVLNDVLHKEQNKDHATKFKYSHKVFYEVAKIPLVKNSDL